MDLWLLGVLHDDPLGPIHLRSWMSLLSHRYDSTPVFVAPEWDEMQYAATVAERPYLAQLLRNEWGESASSLLVEMCARSIGFEADAHRDDLFSVAETETYFPDYKRHDAHFWVANAAFPIFRNRLADANLAQDPVKSLRRLEEQAYVWADHANPAARDTARDVYWIVRLLERLARPDANVPGTWAIAVVGAIHLTNCDGLTFAQLLLDAGQPFTVRYVGWVPPAEYQPIVV